MITKLDDHLKPDGELDWDSYRKAEVENGERCYTCGKYTIFGHGSRRRCQACENMEQDSGAVTHSSFVRCPHCDYNGDPSELGLYEEGTHTVYCVDCGKEYEVEAEVSYSFKSPARASKSKASADGEDDS